MFHDNLFFSIIKNECGGVIVLGIRFSKELGRARGLPGELLRFLGQLLPFLLK